MRLIAAFVLVLLSFGSAQAGDANLEQRKVVAKELIAITHTDGNTVAIIDAYWPKMVAMIEGSGHGPDEEVLTRLKPIFRTQFLQVFESASDDYVTAYANAYSLDELKTLVAFYNSPTGRKMMIVQPSIMKEMLPKVATKIQATFPAAMQAVLEEAKKEGLKTGD